MAARRFCFRTLVFCPRMSYLPGIWLPSRALSLLLLLTFLCF
ncbi:hypothetical protein E2C01_058269 [Portunus trituberculatus]|uniref:Uncharacterized protein n=1 Tax=Portunus trituberculatus TaxID=210409 RepID=A0A5B7H489_PORTR|nr:hypothetical protein [Portunus trituberculatus]